ncbi:universal stress protein [Nocardioides mesophilus]|uniref:Universal stress protein n=1 Tax=Nocardioides mesophilus TaxID=433659 RepID=A0A7G9R6G5_9ACTN|nr:universal stress protein [Nocardioides mesophilus]QNN51190.1 universal stress protein [Nocardioides mesophilus]
MIRRSGPVVAAVDGTGDGLRAARYAAQEALRRRSGLRLVHVLHETVAWVPALPAFTYESLRTTGLEILDEAVDAVDDVTGGVLHVEAVLTRGPRVPALLDRMRDASLVVVATRPSTVKRVLTGSTSVALSARSRCPVVCVPETWRPSVGQHRVVAGVDGSEATEPVLDAAFEEAAERDAALTVVHAWRPSSSVDPTTAALAEARWRENADAELERLVEVRHAAYPDVKVHLWLPHEWPADALVEASADADLLVVGRRGHGGLLGLSLGGTSRSLLRVSRCPVAVVPDPLGADLAARAG